jgi:hypothetical protein
MYGKLGAGISTGALAPVAGGASPLALALLATTVVMLGMALWSLAPRLRRSNGR